uniref:Uncharacterized protein n=1 Tax=Kalanchoe fedtschenkoi TaxID=63787 RepID=A0A7N0RHY5_KALFE
MKCLGRRRRRDQGIPCLSSRIGRQLTLQGTTATISLQQHMEQVRCGEAPSGSGNAVDGSNWVDTFVREMTNSADLHDAKERVARILEAFEISIRTRSTVSEGLDLSSLKDHLHILLRDNQILKRAVAIQREREIEQDEKANEVQRLQHIACQCDEQLQKMELTNYSLKIHLQRARENSSIPGQYLPDIY